MSQAQLRSEMRASITQQESLMRLTSFCEWVGSRGEDLRLDVMAALSHDNDMNDDNGKSPESRCAGLLETTRSRARAKQTVSNFKELVWTLSQIADSLDKGLDSGIYVIGQSGGRVGDVDVSTKGTASVPEIRIYEPDQDQDPEVVRWTQALGIEGFMSGDPAQSGNGRQAGKGTSVTSTSRTPSSQDAGDPRIHYQWPPSPSLADCRANVWPLDDVFGFFPEVEVGESAISLPTTPGTDGTPLVDIVVDGRQHRPVGKRISIERNGSMDTDCSEEFACSASSISAREQIPDWELEEVGLGESAPTGSRTSSKRSFERYHAGGDQDYETGRDSWRELSPKRSRHGDSDDMSMTPGGDVLKSASLSSRTAELSGAGEAESEGDGTKDE